MPDVAQIDALEARVAALEAQGPPAVDQLAPNVLTFAGAQVGAKFTGLVNALGLIIPAGAGAVDASNTVSWQRGSDGGSVAQLQGYEPGGGTSTVILAAGGHAVNDDGAVIIAANGAGAGSSFAHLAAQVNAGRSTVSVGTDTTGVDRVLWDNTGRSDFVANYSKIRFTGFFGNNLTTGIWTALPFDTIDRDPDGLAYNFGGGVNNGLRAKQAGDYLVLAEAIMASANSTLLCFASINGAPPGSLGATTGIIGSGGVPGPGFAYAETVLAGFMTLAAGDCVNLWVVAYNVGGPLMVGSGHHCWLAIKRTH